MLMHEWIRYRSQQVKQAREDEEQPGAAEGEEAVDEPEGEAQLAEGESATPEVADDQTAEEAAAAEQAPLHLEGAEPDTEEAVEAAEHEAQAEASDAESTVRDREAVLNSLQEELDRSGNGMKDRLRQLQARQRQLPMDVDEFEDEDDEDRPRRASETRQQLVQRLLDPTLTLREASLLIDVCPTTVRRYTDRGLLNCFRTPGNQRRFRLSEVLEFIERREQGEV